MLSIDCYRKWVEEVKLSVPANKLLIFDIHDQWQSICTFLGLPIPNSPFPVCEEKQIKMDVKPASNTDKYNSRFIYAIPVTLLMFIWYVIKRNRIGGGINTSTTCNKCFLNVVESIIECTINTTFKAILDILFRSGA